MRYLVAFWLASICVPLSTAHADDVTVRLGPGDGFSVQDDTATERLRVADDGGITLAPADVDDLCNATTRGTTKFFQRTTGDRLAVCARTSKGDYLWQDLGGSSCSVVDESTPQTSIVGTVGALASDFYAQSFVADVHRITQLGVYLYEYAAEGQVRLAIAPDLAGDPNASSPIWESPLIDPSASPGWIYLDGLAIDVTPGTLYYLMVDGYQNAGATGAARMGTSLGNPPDTGDPFVYSNDGGISWNPYSSPLAIHVQGCGDVKPVIKAYDSTCTIPGGSTNTTLCEGSFTHTAGPGEFVIAWSSLGIATTTSVANATLIRYSTDGGASWHDCGAQFYNLGNGVGALNNAMASTCRMDLVEGNQYTFGVAYFQGTTSGTSFGTITVLVLPKD
jgi:hypothetical protein